jgi:hypothetical protein
MRSAGCPYIVVTKCISILCAHENDYIYVLRLRFVEADLPLSIGGLARLRHTHHPRVPPIRPEAPISMPA